jgi:outer membrane putative beta-barrel porin/alpha-amylase
MRVVTLIAVGFLVLMPSLASADDTLVKFVGGAASTTIGSYNPVDVLIQSAVEQNKTPFTPLRLRNFGEGWLEPWIPPPSGEQHLVRGGWVNTFNGFFLREIDPAFTFNAGTSGARDEYVGAATLFIPLNRRLEISLFVPFVDSLQRSGRLPSATSFGDLVITPQVMLEETETLSVSALLAIRTPTGETKTGNRKTVLSPAIAVWQDLPAHWQWRGAIGMDFATHGDFTTHRAEGPDQIFDLNLATGNTLTRHEATPFGDLTPFLSANLNQDFGSGTNFTNFSLTPGIRFFLGWHTYFITGVIVPVTHPRTFLPGLTTVLSTGW